MSEAGCNLRCVLHGLQPRVNVRPRPEARRPAPGPEGLSDAVLPRGVYLWRPLQEEAQNAAG